MKIRLLLSYQGTNFFGWQRQRQKRTVQGELEKAIKALFQAEAPLTGSGRTDAGVHAIAQNAHFELPASVSEKKLRRMSIVKALNRLSPPDVSILRAWEAPRGFHARTSAEKKTYIYLIFFSAAPPALLREYILWQKPPPADPDFCPLKPLNKMAQILEGERDFKSFQSSGSDIRETVRTVSRSEWRREAPGLFRYQITGSGFLKQMVRNIAGSQIGLLGRESPEQDFLQILKSRDRRKALRPAPPCGLYLKEVFYPPELERQCRQLV